ncbi:MAG: hypothetical protein K6F97_08890 [Lachnospiraceae bacterium]|nr:hypothetical protein [Lachnospiraceae bacterium]
MSVSFQSVRCPDCGAYLSVEEGKKRIFCSYCGANVIVTNNNEYIYREVNEADIIRAETERMVKLHELEQEKKVSPGEIIKTPTGTIWLIVSVVLVVITFDIISKPDEEMFNLIILLDMIIILWGGIYVFFILPSITEEKLNKKRKEETIRIKKEMGAIKLPSGIMPVTGKNYEMVQYILRMNGFTNVVCINMHDLTLGLFVKPGTIEKVEVDGKEQYSSDELYFPDVEISIYYHGI